MIAVTFRRTNGPLVRVAVPRDDDAAVDFVLACACRHFGDPNAALPPIPAPKPKAKARR